MVGGDAWRAGAIVRSVKIRLRQAGRKSVSSTRLVHPERRPVEGGLSLRALSASKHAFHDRHPRAFATADCYAMRMGCCCACRRRARNCVAIYGVSGARFGDAASRCVAETWRLGFTGNADRLSTATGGGSDRGKVWFGSARRACHPYPVVCRCGPASAGRRVFGSAGMGTQACMPP